MPCPNCPDAPVEYDSATGSSYCTVCGTVLEESTISADITFVEGGDGSSRMVGQFVSAERSGLRSLNMRNRRLNTGQSREETIANARRKFQEVAIALKGLGEYHIERAVQCYKLALMHGFTNGRRQAHVIAACLYIVCRQERTVHMLIDFSDVLHTNVFALGWCFLKLIRLLNIKLPLIDPSLYLSRFAAQLQFGELTARVTQDALRLVQRMKRDWIHYGRRPSGICGACLLIASRMHGFQTSQRDVVRVVKICESTVKKRLNEFSKTASAQLSVDEFRITDLATESNPPCFRAVHIENVEEDKDEGDDEDAGPEALSSEISTILHSKEMDTIRSAPISRQWQDTPVDENVEAWSDLNDSEIEMFLLDDSETKEKTEVWEENNRDWTRLQEAKAEREASAAVDELHTDKMATTATVAVKKTYGAKKRTTVASGRAAGLSASKLAQEKISKKVTQTVSKRINYAALEKIL